MRPENAPETRSTTPGGARISRALPGIGDPGFNQESGDGIPSRQAITLTFIAPFTKVAEFISTKPARFFNLNLIATYQVRADDVQEARGIRIDILGDAKPAHTMLIISALASPDFLLEVEGFACQD